MYKYFLLGIACAFSFNRAFSQVSKDSIIQISKSIVLQKDDLGLGFYEASVTSPHKKDVLYSKSKEWVFRTYKSGKDVIQLDDKDAGTILGHGGFGGLTFTNYGKEDDAGGFRYTFTIKVKDEKFKIKMYDFHYRKGYMSLPEGADIAEEYPDNWPSLGKKKMKKEWDEMKVDADLTVKATITDFILFMIGDEDRW